MGVGLEGSRVTQVGLASRQPGSYKHVHSRKKCKQNRVNEANREAGLGPNLG